MYTREQIRAWKDSGLLDYFANGGQLQARQMDVWYDIDRIDMTLPPDYYRRKDVPAKPVFSKDEIAQQIIRDLNDYVNDGKLMAWAIVALLQPEDALALVNNNYGKYCGCNTATAVKSALVPMTSLYASDWHAKHSQPHGSPPPVELHALQEKYKDLSQHRRHPGPSVN